MDAFLSFSDFQNTQCGTCTQNSGRSHFFDTLNIREGIHGCYCLPFKKHSTCTGYESTIVWHIIPYIGRRQLQDLRTEHVQSVINTLVKERKASSTVRKAYAIMRMACEQAVTNGIILRNPVVKIILPKKTQKEIHFFTLEEQK